MPSLTTGELVSILLDKGVRSLIYIQDPSERIQKVVAFVKKHKVLPAGQTLDLVFDAVLDIASREFGCKRSPKWTRVRKAHLKEHPECAACGGKTSLDVHHIIPYHLRPDLELESSNLLTLCEKSERFGWACHRLLGHTLNWKLHNPNVVKCAKYVRELVAGDSK